MMKNQFVLFSSSLAIRVIGIVVLSLSIWFAGPLLAFAEYHPLETETARLLTIFALITAWLLRHAYQRSKARLSNKKLFEHMSGEHKTALAGESAVHERFCRAVELLKTAHFAAHSGVKKGLLTRLGSKQYAYQLPWFVFIGAPGSGKTTALLHSGLRFPLADQVGQDPVQGIGGTRHCEWWFTDQAILIDTAGRYTTQDSHGEADAQEWAAFLHTIKKFRPRQPINGVLVTISANDLLCGGTTNTSVQGQASAIRARISELQKYLGHAFPIYLLVTKVDLVSGFSQFFEDLSREQREQVWGCTFAADTPADLYKGSARLQPELDLLEKRLFEQVLARLHASHDKTNRALIFNFPNQWRQLRETLSSFISEAFGASQMVAPVWLRGVYFTSGTQEGTPIDRILGTLARNFAIETRNAPSQKPSGKSFFITTLLRDVIFAEAGLAGTNPKEEQRLRLLKWGGIGTLGLALIACSAYWTYSYFQNAAYVDTVEAKAQRFKQSLASRTPDWNGVEPLLTTLEATRQLAHTDAVDPRQAGMGMGGGLFQGEKLQSSANQAYERMLASYFAPMISRRIESGLNKHASNPQLQYETLKAYLMLHDRSKLDLNALKAWVAFDMEAGTGNTLSKEEQQKVLSHLEFLLQRGQLGPDTVPNAKLIATVRQAQLRAPFIERVYSRLKQQANSHEFKEFRLVDAAGANGQLVFTRRSGQPITSGVPGLYTFEGYHKGFNPKLEQTLKQLAEEEAWVLGVKDSENTRRAATPETRQMLANEVRQLYLHDYAAIWERFIADIALIKTNSLPQSIEQAKILSASDSPLPRLLNAVVKEVNLGAKEEKSETAQGKGAPGKLAEVITSSKNKLGSLFNQESAQALAEGNGIESVVDERFQPLRDFMSGKSGNQPAKIDVTIGLINDLYGLLSATEQALKNGNAPPSSEVPNKLRAEAARMPEPLRSMLGTLANRSTTQAQAMNRTNLEARLVSSVGKPCQAAFAGRYPFYRGSKKDVLPDDFVRILAQGGVLTEFFDKHLAVHVDTSGKPWRYRTIGDSAMNSQSGALRQFERAEEIRRTFFPPGNQGLMFRLELKPAYMDPAIDHFMMDLDGQVVSYSHSKVPPMTIQWPGPRATNQIRLQLLAGGKESTQTFEGPWALFRMFDQAHITPTSQPERFRAAFNLNGKKVMVDVTSNGVKNPFRMTELQVFQCPMKL